MTSIDNRSQYNIPSLALVQGNTHELESRSNQASDTIDLPSFSAKTVSVNEPGSLLASNQFRPQNLAPQERFLPAATQIQLLKERGYIQAGAFSLRFHQAQYGVNFDHLVTEFVSVLTDPKGRFNDRIFNGFLRPLLEQAEASGPILAEQHPDLPNGFLNAARSGKALYEAVFTGYTRGHDKDGSFIQADAEVFIKKRNY